MNKMAGEKDHVTKWRENNLTAIWKVENLTDCKSAGCL